MAARQLAVWRLQAKCSREGVLVLTFDDGPTPGITSELLDILGQYDAPATFFMLGRKVRESPELVEHVVAQGHELGSHSQTHLHAWKNLPGPVLADAREGHDELPTRFQSSAPFRPPYGKITLYTWGWALLRGAALGWWTHDSGDTKTPLPSPSAPSEAIKRCRGGVVLLHDLDRSPERNAFVLAATRELLDMARDEGLRVLSMSQLQRLPH